MKSLSEIETISKRASRASGYSWGISEEVGKSIRLLEMFSFKGVKNLNEYFKEKEDKKFENLNLIDEKNVCLEFSYCPIILGVSFLDQIRNLELFNECSFKGIAYPILFLPFLSRGSEIIGKKILFVFDDNQFLLNFNINIHSNLIKENYPLLAKKVQINFIDNKDNFSDMDWKNLYKLSENTFVEETESLKKGAAGAGLTDND